MDTALFILSKIVGFGLRVENWIIFGLAVTVLALFLGRLRLAKVTGSVTLATTLIVSVFPLGTLLMRPLEEPFSPRQPPDRVDGIVILGGGEHIPGTQYWQQIQLNQGAERLTAAAGLALKFPRAKVLISGGSGELRDTFDATAGEASGARDLLVSLGVAPDRILWESRSRNTAENARFSHAMAEPRPDETWVLVTSAFHMGRSLSSFRAAGWTGLVPYPVDFRSESFLRRIGWNPVDNIETLDWAIKEHAGRLAYRLLNR